MIIKMTHKSRNIPVQKLKNMLRKCERIWMKERKNERMVWTRGVFMRQMHMLSLAITTMACSCYFISDLYETAGTNSEMQQRNNQYNTARNPSAGTTIRCEHFMHYNTKNVASSNSSLHKPYKRKWLSKDARSRGEENNEISGRGIIIKKVALYWNTSFKREQTSGWMINALEMTKPVC